MTNQDRKRAAHEGGRDQNEHKRETEPQPEGPQCARPDARARSRDRRPVAPASNRAGKSQRVEADGDLEPTVEREALPYAVGQAAEEQASEGESTHEGGKHRCGGVRRRSEEKLEPPGPHDLVGQGRGARGKKDESR